MSPDDMFPRKARKSAGPGVWYARIWTYDPQVGKAVDVPWSTRIKVEGTTGSRAWKASRERAMLEADKHAKQIAEGTLVKRLTVLDAYTANFKEKTNKGCAPATFEVLSEKWPHVQAHFGDDHLLKAIDDNAMRDFVAALKAGETSSDKIPQTPGSCVRIIKELYFGMRCVNVMPPKFPEVGKLNKGTRNLGGAQFAKLLAHMNPQWRDHLVAYRLTGVRKSELHLIEARHVNMGEGMLTVPGATTANGDDGRTIPIHEQLMPILQRRCKQHPSGPLFETWNNADRDLRDAGIRAGVGSVSFNVIKASFGAELLRAEVPTRDVAEFYGHSSTRMVEEHYNRLQAGKHLGKHLSKIKSIAIDDTTEES